MEGGARVLVRHVLHATLLLVCGLLHSVLYTLPSTKCIARYAQDVSCTVYMLPPTLNRLTLALHVLPRVLNLLSMSTCGGFCTRWDASCGRLLPLGTKCVATCTAYASLLAAMLAAQPQLLPQCKTLPTSRGHLVSDLQFFKTSSAHSAACKSHDNVT